MNTWFTSDNHFGHKNIHLFCPDTRPHSDVDEMNSQMIRRWNQQVEPGDTVWALGDFFFCNATKALSILPELNGNIHLVYGNHDRVIRYNAAVRGYFKSVQEYKELELQGMKFCLFHYPVQEWNNMHRGAIHLYGHIHNQVAPMGGRAFNVCIDSPEFGGDAPYSLRLADTVIEMARGREIRAHHNKVVL